MSQSNIREVNEFGCIEIPKQILEALNIGEGYPFEVYTDCDGNILLKKISVKKTIDLDELSESLCRYIRGVLVMEYGFTNVVINHLHFGTANCLGDITYATAVLTFDSFGDPVERKTINIVPFRLVDNVWSMERIIFEDKLKSAGIAFDRR